MYKGPLEPSYKRSLTPQNEGLENSLCAEAIEKYTKTCSIVDLSLLFLKVYSQLLYKYHLTYL